MATTQNNKSPSFFNFLKEGLLLPTHNRRLFAAVFATIVASSYLLRLLGNDHAVQPPLADEVPIDSKPLNGTTDPNSREFHDLIHEIMDDTRNLLLTGAVHGLVSTSVGWVTPIITLFAAVATYSGELLTFASLLGEAKAQLKGPLLTLAFVYVLTMASIAPLPATARLLTFLMFRRYLALAFVGALLAIVVLIFLVCFSFVSSLSIVVAVAEPGCHGAGALGRAWRLTKTKLLRVVLFVAVTAVLDAAVWLILSNMASGWLRGFLRTTLMAAVQVFDVCAKTAFYYEGKGAPRHHRRRGTPWCLPMTTR